MDENQSINQNSTTQEPDLGTCPFLGLKNDRQTHFASASLGNYCYKVKPSQPVNLPYQSEYCLNGNYRQCEVYREAWKGGKNGQDEKVDASTAEESVAAAVLPASPAQPALALAGSASPVAEDVLEEEQLFSDLHQPSAGAYRDFPEQRGPGIWSLVFAVALLVFSVSIWGAYTRLSRLRQAENAAAQLARLQTATAAVAVLPPTPEPTATVVVIIPPTSTPTQDRPATAAAATQAAIQTAEQAAFVLTQSAPSPTPTVPSDCTAASAYPFVLVSGPDLTPPVGYVYQAGRAAPSVRAAWKIKGWGSCAWSQIALLSPQSQDILKPLIRVNGQEIFLAPGQVPPNLIGQEVEVVLGFRPSNARSFDREWILVINGVTLLDQPHLILKVDDWVIAVEATATPEKTRPPRTPAPRSRATETPSGATP